MNHILNRASESTLRRLGRNTIISLSSQILVVVAGVASLYFNARSLGVGGLGKLTLILAVAALLEKLLTLQTWQAVQVLGPRREQEIFGGALVFDAAALAIAAAAGLVIAYLAMPEGMLLMLSIAFRLQDPALGLLRLRNRFATIAAIEVAQSLASTILAFVLWKSHAELQSYVLAAAAVSVSTNVLTVAIACADTAPQFPARRILRDVLAFAIPAGASSTIGTLRQSGIVPLLGLMSGPLAVGVFAVAERFGSVLVLLNGVITQAVFREIKEHVRLLVFLTGAVGLIAAALFGLLFAVAGSTIISLATGPHFQAALPVLLILIAAHAVSLACVGFRAAVIVNTGPAAMFRCDAGAAFTLLLAPLLIAWAGAAGAAISYLVYEIAWLLIAMSMFHNQPYLKAPVR